MPLYLPLSMHLIEPFYGWRTYYVASEDPSSPFFEREYSEFEFSNKIYNFYIHPQWDYFGSSTLFIKILFVEYEDQFAVLEMIGEWNDAIENDIMILKRDIIEPLMHSGINKFILIGENVLNYHFSDDCYYEEWFDEVEDGWIALINFHVHVLSEFERIQIDHYFAMGGELEEIEWRTYTPFQFFKKVESLVDKRLN
ncbi:MAG: hypothetical protein LW688_01285 [Cryomorphaceae bacterium]|nr:hypothetical protein [Cryomorphaceae bacterium]